MNDRYESAHHRLQSATAIMTTRALGIGVGNKMGDLDVEALNRFLKYQRTGLNSAMASQDGLARLLMEKDVFTEAEYRESMTVAMEREADRACAEAIEKLGLPPGTTFG